MKNSLYPLRSLCFKYSISISDNLSILHTNIKILDSRFHGNDMPFFIWNRLVTSRKFLYLPVTPFYHRVV